MEFLDKFNTIVRKLFIADLKESDFDTEPDAIDRTELLHLLNSAFLLALTSSNSDNSGLQFIKKIKNNDQLKHIADFYIYGLEKIPEELNQVFKNYPDFTERLDQLYQFLLEKQNQKIKNTLREKIWAVFFPEGVGIAENLIQHISQLRNKRVVKISKLNQNPITNPAKQILFTSNILLTLPSSEQDVEKLSISTNLKNKLKESFTEKQVFWYDHPIPIGIAPENNEIIYGLRGLDEACRYEKSQGTLQRADKLACVLSVSVTHNGLHQIAKEYIESEIKSYAKFENLDIYVLTEDDTRAILENILIPAAQKYLPEVSAKDFNNIFGVDGEYSRHYNFLKAIAALWHVLINPEIKATFKIDLDQVFPQNNLKKETGFSTFEHFKTPLWGAEGIDNNGNNVQLDMIAGALVNEKDIHKSIFTADVPFPDVSQINPDEYIFYSKLPQALSTVSEMMTKYENNDFDGKRKCIHRIHVTGGTNGILIRALFKYMPFVPTFIGRAEDQAYLMSVFDNSGQKSLAYTHKSGLIMRHDKESFAGEAIKAAEIGKLTGDYIRMLFFSYYAQTISPDISRIKEKFDPFTGCFISRIPVTVTYLRFSLKVQHNFIQGKGENTVNFISTASDRILKALRLVPQIPQIVKNERKAWKHFYNILDALNTEISVKDFFINEIRKESKKIIKHSHLNLS